MQYRGQDLVSEIFLQILKAQRDRLRQEVEAMEVEKEIAMLEATRGQLTKERQGPAAGAQDEPLEDGHGSNGSRATSPSSPGSKRQSPEHVGFRAVPAVPRWMTRRCNGKRKIDSSKWALHGRTQ